MPDSHAHAPAAGEAIDPCPYCAAPDFWWLLIRERRGPCCAYCGAPEAWSEQLVKAHADG